MEINVINPNSRGLMKGDGCFFTLLMIDSSKAIEIRKILENQAKYTIKVT
jgi:hypothetical protein